MNVSLLPLLQVIPRLSATVDYNRLPGGVIALTSIHESHPDIQITYNTSGDLYSLHGTYSKVQAALMQLLGHPGTPQPAENNDAGRQTTSDFNSVQIEQKPHMEDSEDLSRKSNAHTEQREKIHIGSNFEEYKSGSHKDLTPSGYDWEDTGQRASAAQQLPGSPTMPDEDFLLIVDADMFQYVQKHCQKEYLQILSQYGVDVVDVTNQGLTSLFLQLATRARGDDRDQEHLKSARQAMSSFFQENESNIRRAQLPKSILSFRGGLQRAKEKLSVRLPKIILNEDDQFIYIIGGSRDVTEAKQFLLEHTEKKARKEDVASLLRFPSYESGCTSPAEDRRATLTTSSAVDFLDDPVDQHLKSEEDERRSDGARRYKLAARFKDTKLAALGNRPPDFSSLTGLSSPNRPAFPGSPLRYDVLSETDNAGERDSRASSQTSGGDILFRSGDPLVPGASVQNKTSVSSNVADARPKSLTPPFSLTLAGSASYPHDGSGSTLKRANSFSGTPQQTSRVMSPRSQDDNSRSTGRTASRSSSSSNLTGRDKQGDCSAEITLSFVMWQYIKEAYTTRVADLTSDLQMRESHPQGSTELTVILRGANSSKVNSCRQGLERLVDSVGTDFSVHELRLSELGISGAADETLQACCAEVRSRFMKVTTLILKKSLFLLGPQLLCSQVAASLREVFSGDLVQRTEQLEFCSLLTPSTFLQTDEDQNATLHCYNKPHVIRESHTSTADGTDSSFPEPELQNGSVSRPLPGKDPVIKEKVKLVGTGDINGQKAIVSKTGSDKSANGVGPAKTHAGKDVALHTKERTFHSARKDGVRQRNAEVDDTPEEPGSGVGDPGCICACGDSEKLMTKTKCGASMCSKCLNSVHAHCTVCHETEPTSRGIQGKVNYSRLNFSLQGHKEGSAIKITYHIPDGIQEVRDFSLVSTTHQCFYSVFSQISLIDRIRPLKYVPTKSKSLFTSLAEF